MADLAKIASEVTEREVRRFVVADDLSRNAEVAQPVPATMADMLLAK